jgi:hypothetical protein
MLTHEDTHHRLLAREEARAGQLPFFFFFNGNGFEILGLEDLTAIQAFHVIHAVSPRDDLCAGVFTRGLHKAILDLF